MKKINIKTIKNIIKGVVSFIFDTIKVIIRIINILVTGISTCIVDICDELYYLIFNYKD